MPTTRLSLTALQQIPFLLLLLLLLLFLFLLALPHCSAFRLTTPGAPPDAVNRLPVALARATSPAFEVQCVCASRVGGCLPNSNACGATAQDCERGCACSADGGGYGCADTTACTGSELGDVCGASSPNHVTGRGMHCSCVPAAPAASATAL